MIEPKKPACIVKAHVAGLFSNINKVITCMSLYDHVHVDWSENCIYGDAWNHLFQPTIPPTDEFDTIVEYPNTRITFSHVAQLYTGHSQWRHEYHLLWKRFGVLEEIYNRVDKFYDSTIKGNNVVAIMVRSNAHASEQVTGRVQALDDYASAIDQFGNVIVYAMCWDEESLAWFSRRFPLCFEPNATWSKSRDIDNLMAEPHSYKDAQQCLVEVMIAARCKAMIHPVSNMATGALYINPNLQSVYLR